MDRGWRILAIKCTGCDFREAILQPETERLKKIGILIIWHYKTAQFGLEI